MLHAHATCPIENHLTPSNSNMGKTAPSLPGGLRFAEPGGRLGDSAPKAIIARAASGAANGGRFDLREWRGRRESNGRS